MRKSELREGNWINREDLVSRKLRTEKIIHLAEKATTTGGVKVICDYKDLKPISLSEEWLLKFGFKKAPAEKYRKFSFVIDWWYDSGKFMYGWIGGNVELKYVHQLQNLYLALTNEELSL